MLPNKHLQMIDPAKFGVSFSSKQCHNFGINSHDALDWLLAQGWRRFRLMSYWTICEPQSGKYDFAELDWQLARITEAGGIVSMCLGVKQPRWPEYHWPKWVLALPPAQRDTALLDFVQATVKHFRSNKTIVSWQLENEALLSNFGARIQIDRARLRQEYQLVKKLDSKRPVIMSTSNGWGVPLRRPIPDIVGFSQYFVRYEKGNYYQTKQPPALHKLRKFLVAASSGKPAFIHELQLEPWGPKAIWHMTSTEQAKSMSTKQIKHNIQSAKAVNAYPIDCWGSEWWYWRAQNSDDSIWRAVSEAVQ